MTPLNFNNKTKFKMPNGLEKIITEDKTKLLEEIFMAKN